MTFTIAIPARNGSNYLADAIRSALGQTRPADEILVVDDNSDDETAAIAKSREWGNRVKYYFNQTPTGFADAWNRAVAKATCDFVSILHQDDLLDPDYLSAIESGLTRFPQSRHAFTACRYINGAGAVDVHRKAPEPHSGEPVLISGRDYAHRYLLGVWNNRHIHRCPGVTTLRSLLMEQCAYRKEAGHIADDDFFYRVGRFTDVVGISKPMASYREHESSTTSRVKLLHLVLARDYLFQIRHKQDRSVIFEQTDELIFEKLAVKMLNESLYKILRAHSSEWSTILDLANELDTLAPNAFNKYLPVWSHPIWGAFKGGHIQAASLCVSVIALHRGIRTRLALRRRLLSLCRFIEKPIDK
jgi:glycosyltransferase involved in cell wall biosynthesis